MNDKFREIMETIPKEVKPELYSIILDAVVEGYKLGAIETVNSLDKHLWLNANIVTMR